MINSLSFLPGAARRAPVRLKRVSVVGLLVTLVACWHGVTVYGTRMVPGQLYLPHVEALALVPIDGPGGAGLEHAIRLELLRSHSFEVLDAATIEARGEGLKSGTGNDKRVALVLGEVLEHEFVDHFDYAQHGHGAAARSTYTRGADLVFRAAIRFVDRLSGEILDSTIVQMQAEMPLEEVTVAGEANADPDVMGQYFAPRDTGHIYGQAYLHMAGMLGDQLRGRSRPEKVNLFHPAFGGGFDSHDALAKARANDWQGASHIYRKALHAADVAGKIDEKHRAYLLANIGTCDAMSGALEQGLDMLDAAAASGVSDEVRAQRDLVAGWAAQAQTAQKPSY